MSHFTTKTSPEDDLYIMWSTVVDAPIYVFESTEDLRAYVTREYAQGRYATPPAEYIKRTQETGSSIRGWSVGKWDDEDQLVREGTPDPPAGHYWVLPRGNQTAYAKALLAEDDDLANSFLVAIPQDD